MSRADYPCRHDLAKSKAALDLKKAEAIAKAVQSAQQQLKPIVEQIKQEAEVRKEEEKKQQVTSGVCLCVVP